MLVLMDKSTTHIMGENIVNEWLLRENHESPRAGKVFVMFFKEVMTSVQQVVDIGIILIMKKAIKGHYQAKQSRDVIRRLGIVQLTRASLSQSLQEA
jgi:hypothetical protein